MLATQPTVIEGIGRPRVEPGFLFEIVDAVVEVADAASIAGMQLLEALLGRRYGGSSGTNLVACLQLAARMRARGERGSIVSLLCDRGERYEQTLFDDAWLAQHRIDPAPWRARLEACIARWHVVAAVVLEAVRLRVPVVDSVFFRLRGRPTRVVELARIVLQRLPQRGERSRVLRIGLQCRRALQQPGDDRVQRGIGLRLERAVGDQVSDLGFDAVASVAACAGPMCPCS